MTFTKICVSLIPQIYFNCVRMHMLTTQCQNKAIFCNLFSFSTIMTLGSQTCLQVMGGVCEFISTNPVFKAYQSVTVTIALDSSVVGYFNNPMNSVTGNLNFNMTQMFKTSLICFCKIYC